MSRLAAVTGGTGFLGRETILALRRAGWRVRLLARSTYTHPQLVGGADERILGDLRDTNALRHLVTGADVIIHMAGLVKALSRRDFMTINAEGSGTLAIMAATHAPDAKLICVSSMAAREPHLSPYAASKKSGEDRIISGFEGKDWLIIRPPAIYGPWDVSLLPLFRSLQLPAVPVFAPPEARIAVIHVRDAAQAITNLSGDGPSRKILELSDERPDGYSWGEILALAANAVGASRPVIKLPGGALVFAGALSEIVAQIRRRPSILCRGKAREMLHPNWSADPGKRPPAIIWCPKIPLMQGLSETVSWYRNAGWL